MFLICKQHVGLFVTGIKGVQHESTYVVNCGPLRFGGRYRLVIFYWLPEDVHEAQEQSLSDDGRMDVWVRVLAIAQT